MSTITNRSNNLDLGRSIQQLEAYFDLRTQGRKAMPVGEIMEWNEGRKSWQNVISAYRELRKETYYLRRVRNEYEQLLLTPKSKLVCRKRLQKIARMIVHD